MTRPIKCKHCDYIESSYIGHVCGHPIIKEKIQIYERRYKQKHSLLNIKVDANREPPINCPIEE